MDTILEAFREFLVTWAFLLLAILLSCLVIREFYRYFNNKMLSTPKSTVEKLRAIWEMEYSEEKELGDKNDPLLVKRLKIEAIRTLGIYDHEGDTKRFQTQANVVLETHKKLKANGQHLRR